MIVTRTEQHVINKNNAMWETVDELCFKSKNLYNYANYIIRQEFINNNKWIRYNQMDKIVQKHETYTSLGSQASQKTLELLDKNWKSFFKAIKDWSKNKSKYLGRPRLPKYKNKDGRFILMLKNIQCRIENGYLVFSWKPFRQFKIKTNVNGKLQQVRFVPRGSSYVLEIVYQIKAKECYLDSKNIIGIDLGVNNFATITNNIGNKPIVINGKIIKSVNQYYNKKKAELQSELKRKHDKHWSNKLQRLTDKRNNKIKHFMHCTSKYITEYCIKNKIDTVVLGLNKTWKQESKLSKKTNQNFVQISYDMFINQLKYKCENVGIKFIETEESYTSGTSFLDGEMPTKINYDKSRRIKRGLFKSCTGMIINADVNGSYQIIRKVFPKCFNDGIEGVGLHPVRVNII